MVTAKANTLLFEGWWREEVVAEAGARVRFADLFSSYRRSMVVPMGRQAFVARLNGLGVKEEKEKGIRWRVGVRLRAPADAEASRPPVGVVMAAARKGEMMEVALGAPAPPPAKPAEAPLYRVNPYVPGMSETATMLMLDVSTVDDLASGRVAEELFRARVRQRRPVEAGGEGFSNERDDHYAGDLALAASAYAFAAGQPEDYREFLVMNGKPVRTANFGWHVLEIVRRLWPWDAACWKPRTAREDLVRAGALVLAAIEKLDRAEARARLSADEQLKATGV